MNIRCRTILLIAFSCLALGGCAQFSLKSAWRDHEIVIDGKDTEWQDRMVKQGNVAFGASNDGQFLYLCLAVTDKKSKAQLMGLFRQSFCVWFDPEGKRKKALGVRFTNESPMMDESLVRKIKQITTPTFQLIANEMMSNLIIEVERREYPVALLSDAPGIDVAAAISMNGRKLVYEMKVPLGRSEAHPFAIGALQGKPVSIGVEATPIDWGFLYAEQAKIMYGSGGGGQGRRSMSASGGQDAYMLPDEIHRVSVWGKIQLAAQVK